LRSQKEFNVVIITSCVPGMTAEMYDGMAAALNPVLRSSPGFVAHAAAPIPGGFLVTELWESEEAFAAWFNGHVRGPAQAAGLSPINTITPAHNIISR
jgi:heme-degrading monooxygenase HmoA